MHKISNGREMRRESASEEFWDDLLAYMGDKCVVPVVGPELLTVVIDGREVPLYRAVAERLLGKYSLHGRDVSSADADIDNQVALRPHSELHDAVSALVENEHRAISLYRRINSELRELLDAEPKIPSALRELAQITDFSLYVTTTSDDLLARAIKAARPDIGNVQTVAYAPNLQKQDLPEIAPPDYTCVFHMFGQASSSPTYAVCEEDVLEFIYRLHAGDGPRPDRMLAKLRDSHLLLIGCNFTDWLSRFFIRLSSKERLWGGRDKGEFLVGDVAAHDQSLTMFLERYSRDTRLYPGGDAAGFISELLRRWEERRPAPATAANIEIPPSFSGPGSVFLSYAREDYDAAKRMFSALEAIGAGVPWFDKRNLRAGDEWERSIQAAIKRCDLFLPLLSANTEKRREGYFRGEWTSAVERKKNIFGPFIIPVVIDPEWRQDVSDYKKIPGDFKAFDFAHAPLGEMSENLGNILREKLRNLRRREKS